MRFLSFGLLAAFVSGLHAAQPWDRPFATDTASILQAANAVPAKADHPVVMLLDEQLYSIDAKGATTTTLRSVYRVMSPDAVDDFSTVEHTYQPWFENVPAIRARVITRDGKVHQLDQSTIAESPARQFDNTVFSDSRIRSAPLPAVAEGAVVEWEVVVREKAPMLDAGVVRRVSIHDFQPLRRFHIVIDADPAVKIASSVKLIDSKLVTTEVRNGRTHIECELGPIEPRKDREFSLPPDLTDTPYIAFSTGASWQSIAARYSSIVDRQIAGADLAQLTAGVNRNAAPAEVAAQLVSRLHREARYTGVEFGEAAIVPNTPAETLKRKYGDCKDKSSLLVAMLRSMGLKASVALLDSGFDTDIDRDLPGMGRFNHAIVYVDATPPLWIDATAEHMRVGVIPEGVQGRLALIAAPSTTGLTPIPELADKDNWQKHVIEVRMSDMGRGAFHEEMQFYGTLEASVRPNYAEEKKSREALEGYVKQNYAGTLKNFKITPSGDFSTPFTITLDAENALRANTGFDDAGVAIFPHLVFESAPYQLKAENQKPSETEDASEAPKPRRADFYVTSPYHYEVVHRIFPPAGYKLTTPLPDIDAAMGPARYKRTLVTAPDGHFELTYTFDTGKRRITAAEFRAFRDGLKEHYQRAVTLLTLVPETAELLAAGMTGKAIEAAQASVRKAPDSASARVRYSRTLLAGGMGGQALREARKATELAPKSALAWQSLAWVYQHDTFGRRFHGNWSLADAEKALRKAIEVDPKDTLAPMDLAILLEHNQQGFRYGAGARYDEAIALYRDVIKKQPTATLEYTLAVSLLYAGRFDEALTQVKKCSAEQQAAINTVVSALKAGPARAIINAQTAYPDPNQRAQFLLNVAVTLVQLRRYDTAATVAQAAARLNHSSDFQARADNFARLKRVEETLLPETDPRSVIQRLFLEMTRGTADKARMQALMTKRETWKDEDFDKLNGALTAERAQFAAIGLNAENFVDFILSLVTIEQKGDDQQGYRLTLEGPSAKKWTAYVAREGSEYRLLGGSNGGLEHVGAVILELLDHKDLKAAQWWLDQVAADVEPQEDGTGFPAIHSIWSGIKPETRTAEIARSGAWAMIGSSSASPWAIEALRAQRNRATLTSLEKADFDKALCEAFIRTGQWSEMLPVAKRLAASKAFPEEGFRYSLRAARELANWKELESIAQQRLAVVRNNSVALRSMALARMKQNDPEGARKWTEKLLASDLAGLDEKIFQTWMAIISNNVPATLASELKKKGENIASSRLFEVTMAAVETVLKHPDEAQHYLRSAIDREDYRDLDACPWVIHGKIAQSYGLDEEAAEAFDRARKAKHEKDEASWALLLLP